MVITPQKANERNLTQNAGLLKQLEESIDAALVSKFVPGDINGVCITPPKGLGYNSPVFLQLKEMYQTAGWNVKYESDQRDGDLIRLTARRQK